MNNKLTLAALAALLTLGACDKKNETTETTTTAPEVFGENDALLFGNPTDARRSAEFSENYLISEPTYHVAYSASRGIPVWVAWHLQMPEDTGRAVRMDDFRENPRLPASYYDVRPSDYVGNTFNRGHNIPSADRTNTQANNSSTFLMTNMIPQAPQFNQGPWGNLEDYIRTSLGTNKEAYIYMGNYGTGGVGNNNVVTNTLGSGVVTVPKNVYKIVVILPKGSDDLNRIDTSAQVLAVDMPNDNRLYPSGSNSAWQNYKVPIDSIEARLARAGRPHNFLKAVRSDVRTYLKAKQFR
ncbi:MAG: DNA/RNA non-specific endonuclease [Chitinophagaceae bacterium]|nr:MAG: DNA/RNA non-specific endonuclease [Chitinophagaceae bacterium]